MSFNGLRNFSIEFMIYLIDVKQNVLWILIKTKTNTTRSILRNEHRVVPMITPQIYVIIWPPAIVYIGITRQLKTQNVKYIFKRLLFYVFHPSADLNLVCYSKCLLVCFKWEGESYPRQFLWTGPHKVIDEQEVL